MPAKRPPLSIPAPAALAVLIVLGAYAFFASGGRFSFRRISWEGSTYAGLAEGFFRGHLYMANEPDPRLMALPFPYDLKAREGHVDYLWDASYLNGHYYLYFSPLPVLLFYMPYRLLRGAYPPDALVAAVFSAWSFLAATAFARRALALTGRQPRVPFALWILLIGFGNVAPFLLSDIRIYEVAIMVGAAMTATWAFALARFVEQPTARRAAWVGVWLALSIAARPNVGVLMAVAAAVIVTAAAAKERRRALIAAAVPLAVVGIAMLAYNIIRFQKPFEFGQSYQLTFVPMEGRAVCSLCNFGELTRFGNTLLHYLYWTPVIRSEFPFVNMSWANPDPKTSFPMPGSEQMLGVAPLIPLAMLGTLFALLFVLRRGRADAGTRVGMQVMAASWLILLALSTCWWIVSRYSLDFMLLMAGATVVLVEAGLAFLESAGIRLLPMRVAVIALAVYTIVLGFMLGFAGPADGFKRLNPKLFERLAQRMK